jgi:sec-independent protein translocase protein TatA
MDFFGMGMGEILLILVLVLLMWGPKRVVEAGRTLGRVMHKLRKATSDLTIQITGEVEESDSKKSKQPKSQ